MSNKTVYNKIFVLGLPILAVIFANVTVSLHLKSFCLIKLITHHDCWGCGLTRAFVALSHGQFQQAYDYNHLIIIFFPLLIIVWFFMLKETFDF